MRRVIVALCAALTLAGAAPQTSYNDVEDEVMCPVCGVPLNIAESPQAQDEKRFVRGLIAQGKTKAEVKDALVGEYGQAVLATPARSGFQLTAYLVPLALIVALAVGLAVLIPRWRRRTPAPFAAGAAGPELSTVDARRLDEDLARYT